MARRFAGLVGGHTSPQFEARFSFPTSERCACERRPVSCLYVVAVWPRSRILPRMRARWGSPTTVGLSHPRHGDAYRGAIVRRFLAAASTAAVEKRIGMYS